ncbi:MAG: hypothetical protein WAV15_02540 [Minisyncoccia bacterium]
MNRNNEETFELECRHLVQLLRQEEGLSLQDLQDQDNPVALELVEDFCEEAGISREWFEGFVGRMILALN